VPPLRPAPLEVPRDARTGALEVDCVPSLGLSAVRTGGGAGIVLGATVGALTGVLRRRARRACNRRIEQDGIFAHQASARPVHLDQEGYERFRDGVSRSDLQDISAITAALAYLETQSGRNGGRSIP